MPRKFADKYLLAVEQAVKEKPSGGLNGFEQEWNLLDEDLRPLLTVGAGPSQHSFVDYLRAECVPQWQAQFSQLEVFHWMIEWATRPFYSPRGAIYEARLQEATLINALHRAGISFGERLHYWHGNLLFLTDIGHDSIPGNWGLAKRRYLEKCVDLYGATLATTGIHTNMSLPDPLFAWDFMHLSPTERGDQHLDEYKSEFYITATRGGQPPRPSPIRPSKTEIRPFCKIATCSRPSGCRAARPRKATQLPRFDGVHSSIRLFRASVSAHISRKARDTVAAAQDGNHLRTDRDRAAPQSHCQIALGFLRASEATCNLAAKDIRFHRGLNQISGEPCAHGAKKLD